MADLIKTKGIVLHEMPIKDQDKRIVLFSKDYGKMIVFANGAKRAKSPLLAGTQPFVFGEFTLMESRNSYTLRQVTIDESFYELRNDMATLAYGLYLMEVTNSVIQENDPNQDLLRLLYVSLLNLKLEIQSGEIIRSIFEFRSLNSLGFAPDLSGCQQCGALESSYHLSYNGGLVCSSCSNNKVKALSSEGLHVLRFIQGSSLKKLFHFKMDKTLYNEIQPVITNYFKHFVTGNFKSLDIIDF